MGKMKLPIEISDFKTVIEYRDSNGISYSLVDKSIFIYQVLNESSMVM